MRKAGGFTLIELIIVVIAIGILATFAVPQYLKTIERAKTSKARHALGLIAQAEKAYRAENDKYLDVKQADLNSTTVGTGLGGFVELDEVVADKDWGYEVSGSSASAFLVTAKRSNGNYSGKTVSLNQSGAWAGDLPKEVGGEGVSSTPTT